MVRCALTGLVLAVLVGACTQENPSPTDDPNAPEEFTPAVNATVIPQRTTIPDAQGNDQPVCASRDADGVQSDFVEGVVLIKPRSAADLQAFLERYDGEVIDDDTIPVPPPELGITLTDEERAPTEFVVRINLDMVDLADFESNAEGFGLSGVFEFTSQAGLRTFAGLLDAKASGFAAVANYVYESTQALPVGATGTFFRTQEAPTGPGAFIDAFSEPRFGAAGSQSNVTLAWQFLFAHGIQRRARVAIIDGGFWLDAAGRARGTNSDFIPPPNRPTQYDFAAEDAVADGPTTMGCGAGNPCYWHGTGAASVAAGIVDNRLAYAGTGGLVADPLLFKFSGTRDQRNQAVRTAVAWGADVVSMSFGGDCNLGCRIDDRDDTPFSDAVAAGSRIVFLAAAGNGRGMPAVGYDVGSPSYVHPCIEDHVICVGALADNTTTKIGYSNFGSRVNIFAPTNIPVMSYPDSFDAMGNPLPIAQASGPEMAQPTFGGTSASTPFVAGIVAMMKSLNPELTGAEVAQILAETASPGTPPANRCIDALACVRRAAEGRGILDDRYEPNDLEDTPTDLGAAAPITQPNLNIEAGDRDYFRFVSPGSSTMTLSLQYAAGLGAVDVFSLYSQGGQCTTSTLLSEVALPGNTGRTFTYRVPGGTLDLGLSATGVNAYNLGISFATVSLGADTYESNDTVASARYLYSLKPASSGVYKYLAIDPRATIDATIHAATDVDYYIVRGAAESAAEFVFLIGSPAVLVYGNDSPINLEVYRLNEDNTQGTLVQSLTGSSCTAEALRVPLTADEYYLVKVSGTVGSYRLTNGVSGDRRRFPELVRDRIYEILNPGDPVIKRLRAPEVYAFVGDRAYGAIRSNRTQLNIALLDFDGNQVAEGLPDQAGLRLDLSAVVGDQVYALQLTPSDGAAEDLEVELEWEPAEPLGTSANLIVNPGAEITVSDEDTAVPGWGIIDGDPRIYYYNEEEGGPFPDGPGPEDRGLHLFAGGYASGPSIMQQTIEIDPAWHAAIDAEHVKYRYFAFLGGYLDQEDYTAATLMFLDPEKQSLGDVSLPPITPRERDGETGLLPVEISGYVPVGTQYLRVELAFHRFAGDFIDGYADNLELTLSEYAP